MHDKVKDPRYGSPVARTRVSRGEKFRIRLFVLAIPGQRRAKVVCGSDNQLPRDHGLLYSSGNKDRQLPWRRKGARIGSWAY